MALRKQLACKCLSGWYTVARLKCGEAGTKLFIVKQRVRHIWVAGEDTGECLSELQLAWVIAAPLLGIFRSGESKAVCEVGL